MKKSILIMLLSCCMIIAFSIPVLATSYTWTQGGGATKVKYDLKSVDEAFVMKAIQEACGTTENVYYVCCLTEAFINDPEYYGNVHIFIMLNVEDVGIKGNVGYVKDDSNGLYTDSFNTVPHWKEISISDNGKYMSRYNDCSSSSPWTRYVGMPECVTITNIPVFYTKEGLDNYFATGNTSDMVGAESEYSAEAPHITDAYIKYDYVVYKDGSKMFDPDLYFTMPEIEDKTYKTYVRVILEGNFSLVQMPMDSVKETLPYTRNFLGEKVYQYSTDECFYDYSENIRDTEVIFQDFNYLVLSKKAVFTQYVSAETTKVSFILYMDNGVTRGDYTLLSIDKNGLQTTEFKNALGVVHSNPKIGNENIDIIDGNKDITDGIDSTDIKDSIPVNKDNVEPDNSNLINSITSGFGLIGKDGLIPMLGQIFSFIPKELITLIVSTFGIVCMVIVIKFVRG